MRWYPLIIASLVSQAIALPQAHEYEAMTHEHVERHNHGGCPEGGFIIAVSGHSNITNATSVAKMGYLKKLVMGVKDGIQQKTEVRTIHYPRASDDLPWAVPIGVNHLKKRIMQYVDKCPNSPLILIGYSEGAFITMNTLCGTDSVHYTPEPALPAQYLKNLVAGIVYADISQIAGQPYNMGTCQTNGTRARSNPQDCLPYASKIQSYCDTDDLYCCDPGTSMEVHHSYSGIYTANATQWVLGQYEKFQS